MACEIVRTIISTKKKLPRTGHTSLVPRNKGEQDTEPVASLLCIAAREDHVRHGH